MRVGIVVIHALTVLSEYWIPDEKIANMPYNAEDGLLKSRLMNTVLLMVETITDVQRAH